MAQYKNSGLDSKSLAEKKSKRLEEALSAYTPEQTKQTVSKLLEKFVDEGSKNYFGAGNRDTTLYFADDDYIREIEKEKAKDKEKPHHKEEKSSVVDKLHKLTSILPKAEHNDKAEEPEEEEAAAEEKPVETLEPVREEESEVTAPEEETAAEEPQTIEEEPQEDTEKQEEISAAEVKEADESKKAEMPEPEPTIVITPVKAEASEKEDTEEMRREFFDDEVEVEAVPRRRRKQAEAPAEEKAAPEIKIDDVENEDYEEDFEEEEEKKSKFGNFFKRKNSDPFEDDDEFDDDEFDDDYFDDEYDDYDEGGSVFKKVLNAVVIIALVCSTAFFAASNYSNIKKLESANTQINELNNGTSGGSDEEINALKAKVDELTAENERLKNGGTTSNTNSSEPASVASGSTSSGSTTITGTAPSDEGSSSSSGSTYTIKAGDTGSKICKAVYGQYTEEAWQKILEANGMTASSVYHPGDVLQIP